VQGREGSLGFLFFDRGSYAKTADDQALNGGGPSCADPTDMGKPVPYIDPGGSLFDFDAADRAGRRFQTYGFSLTHVPDFPPVFSNRRTDWMLIPRSTALHMS